jgi:hypothetical protein
MIGSKWLGGDSVIPGRVPTRDQDAARDVGLTIDARRCGTEEIGCMATRWAVRGMEMEQNAIGRDDSGRRDTIDPDGVGEEW